MDVREFALQLLRENDCSLDCYKGEFGEKYALSDMVEYAKENEVPFPVEEVAKALIEIGNEQPDPPRKGHCRYCMIYDVGHTVDGIEYDDFEAAKDAAVCTLVDWVVEEQVSWKLDENGVPHPTEEQIDRWDDMIRDCCTYVVEWDDEAGTWEDMDDAWFPSSADEDDANWLYWDELKTKYNW